ncbi:GNAT family N-acetyltransferase [Devosia sp. RR2S18]|uniref:GNAT family N-acetyltransferase n=1 Tax=Devosia rhizosphaerae TaxID=3049774 RepID=UPI00254202C9|nr:GNAT family N-acetyltransferase [Devosia sp. RR2S18]WIJ26447.1 GNAT family N-acetyltransferase [Devosia sp. RR2S18]
MLTIRPYTTSDREGLVDIWLEASRVGHPFLSEQDLREQKVLVRDVYLPKAENWVAVEAGEPLGFIGLLDCFVGGLFVRPSAHGQGVGRVLIEHAASLKGRLEVEVYALNRGALAFYQRLGFTETGRREKDDQGRPLELVRLARPERA